MLKELNAGKPKTFLIYQGKQQFLQCYPVIWKIPCALHVCSCCSWCSALPRTVPPIWKFRISGRWRLREEGKKLMVQKVCVRERGRG